MGLISDILQKVDTVTLSYTAQSFQSVVARHSTELHLMLVLYIALYGLAVLQGVIPATTRELGKHILKAFIIFEVATNWGMFTIFFYDGFTSGPDKLTGALTGGLKATTQLEGIFNSGIHCASRIIEKAGTLDFSITITGHLVALGTLLMTGYALFLIVLSKLGLAILLSLAPLFIALALFRGTQGLFHSWVNYLVNFAMIPVITYALLALVLVIMQEAVVKIEQAGENVKMYDVIPYVLTGLISSLLFGQVNRIASALGGGIALSTMGAFSRYVNTPAQRLAKTAVRAPIQAAKKLREKNKKPPPPPPPPPPRLEAPKSSQTSSSNTNTQPARSELVKQQTRLSSQSFSEKSSSSSTEKESSSRVSATEYRFDSKPRFQKPQPPSSSGPGTNVSNSPPPPPAPAAQQTVVNQAAPSNAPAPKDSPKPKALEKELKKKKKKI